MVASPWHFRVVAAVLQGLGSMSGRAGYNAFGDSLCAFAATEHWDRRLWSFTEGRGLRGIWHRLRGDSRTHSVSSNRSNEAVVPSRSPFRAMSVISTK